MGFSALLCPRCKMDVTCTGNRIHTYICSSDSLVEAIHRDHETHLGPIHDDNRQRSRSGDTLQPRENICVKLFRVLSAKAVLGTWIATSTGFTLSVLTLLTT